MPSWLAGVARQDITPPVGSLMGAFPTIEGSVRTPRRAVGAHDPCLAQALVLSTGEDMMAICALDVPVINAIDVDDIRRAVHAVEPRLPPARIHIAASHTHHGPETTYKFIDSVAESNPAHPTMVELRRRVAHTICQAAARLEPASLGAGQGVAELNFNRRVMVDGEMTLAHSEPPGGGQGPTDPRVGVLRIDRADGSPLAILVNWAAHPLVMGPGIFEYTADFPGAMRRHLEGVIGHGVEPIFLIGVAGNIHPKIAMTRNWDLVETVGRQLGEIAHAIHRDSVAREDAVLDLRQDTLTFPNRVDPNLRVDLEISVVRIGDIILGFLPGEFFVEFQLEVKRTSPFPNTFLVGCANGSVDYVPVREAYRFGGYGVDLFTTPDPPSLSRTRVNEGASEVVYARLMEMIEAIR